MVQSPPGGDCARARLMAMGCPSFIRCPAGSITALAAAMMFPVEPVVVGQIGRPGPVVGLKPADELRRRAVEGVDVLVVVAHREETEFVVGFRPGSASQGGNHFVLLGSDVLVLVDQYPAETGQQPFPMLVRFLGRQALSPQ